LTITSEINPALVILYFKTDCDPLCFGEMADLLDDYFTEVDIKESFYTPIDPDSHIYERQFSLQISASEGYRFYDESWEI
jgi:hypothetical protein